LRGERIDRERGLSMRSLEERVLRVLYEGSFSALDCVAEPERYGGDRHGLAGDVEHLLTDLAGRSYLEIRRDNGAARYRLTATGSERLAVLAEGSP
jgi:hypothetical protein